MAFEGESLLRQRRRLAADAKRRKAMERDKRIRAWLELMQEIKRPLFSRTTW